MLRYMREDLGGWGARSEIIRYFETKEEAETHLESVKNLEHQHFKYMLFELFELVSIPLPEKNTYAAKGP